MVSVGVLLNGKGGVALPERNALVKWVLWRVGSGGTLEVILGGTPWSLYARAWSPGPTILAICSRQSATAVGR